MKHLESFENKDAALNKVVETPYTAIVEGQEKVIFASPVLGESVTLVEDETGSLVAAIPEPTDDGYVDLGLPSGKKWASCNLGATSPCEYGDFYAWGETTSKDDYSWDNYVFDMDNLSKYNTTDGKKVLDNEDDAVYVATNGAAHMPTKADIEELLAYTNNSWCTCTVLGNDHTSHTVNGRLFVNKTDDTKKIFIPAAGYQYDSGINFRGFGFYVWSSSLYEYDSDHARYLFSYSGNVVSDYDDRYYGYSVRGVRD